MYRLEGMIYNPLLPAPEGTIPLYNWWNKSRKDNFASTNPKWIVPVEDWSVDDDGGNGRPAHPHIRGYHPIENYLVYRLEGFIHDPLLPQPPNTVPLYSWWNKNRQDNMATTDSRWSVNPTDVRWNGQHVIDGPTKEGYTLYRLEGFVQTYNE